MNETPSFVPQMLPFMDETTFSESAEAMPKVPQSVLGSTAIKGSSFKKYNTVNGRRAALLRVRDGVEEKYCYKCEKWKSVADDFGKNNRKRCKVSSWCKSCCVRDTATWRIRKGRWQAPLTGRIQCLLSHISKSGSTIRSSHIREMYRKQGGCCFYTGVPMITMSSIKTDPLLMSMDRIDSSIGYELGNVVLACYGVNVLKGRHGIDRMYANLKTFYEGAKALGKVD